MKTTIVIPAYKAEKFIDEAMLSVINQDEMPNGSEHRVIVVCDGCPDTYRVAKKYASDQVLVCLTAENSGVYNAINLGITLCDLDSSLIGFCGADDVWRPTRAARTVEAHNKASGTLHGFGCMHNHMDEDGGNVRVAGPVNSGQFIYTSSVFRKLGMYRPWVCGADTEFRHRAKGAGCKLHVLNEILFTARQHPNQLTKHIETASGSTNREFAVSEIKRLMRDKSDPVFQNHPIPDLAEYTGRRSNSESTFLRIFPPQPET